LRQYERCAAALNEELGISPSKSTQALYRQIQADQIDEPSSIPIQVDTPPEVPAPSLLEVLGRLAQLQRSLTDLQNEVEQNIQIMQQMRQI
jgi:hypothetical protein